MRVDEACFYFSGRISATTESERFPENKQTVKAHEVAAKFTAARSWAAFRAAWRQAEALTAQAQLLVIDAMKAARVRLTTTRKGERYEENDQATGTEQRQHS